MTDPCLIDPADIPITQGNNYPPAMWQFLISENPDQIFDLSGSVFKLRVSWPGGVDINKSSDVDPDLTVDLTTSILSWNYGTATSRLLPLGRIARYELERWINATQQSLVTGRFVVSPGANPD